MEGKTIEIVTEVVYKALVDKGYLDKPTFWDEVKLQSAKMLTIISALETQHLPPFTQPPAPVANAYPQKIVQGLGVCSNCGAPNKMSKNTGKPYCSAKCWLIG